MFASLNLGNPGWETTPEQDSVENLRENYARLQAGSAGVPVALRAWVRQVHGRNVELVERETEGEYSETLEAEVRDRCSGQVSADAACVARAGAADNSGGGLCAGVAGDG